MPLDSTTTAIASIDLASIPASLSAAARRSLEALFVTGTIPHIPSRDQWAAIEDLLDHLEAAAEGRVARAVHLSAIPPGTGKSASLRAFAAALCTSDAHRDVGMIILCSRVSEVRDMAQALQDHRDRLHVVCDAGKNPEVIGMGDHTSPDGAQVIVATQAGLKASLRGQPCFNLLARYHYQGKPRAVRCWDEAYAMRRPVIIDGDSIEGLTRAIRKQSPEAVVALKSWTLGLETAVTGPCQVPDFTALGVDFQALEEDCRDQEDWIAQCKALREVSGETAWVHRDNLRGPSLVKHIPELPETLLPVFVTDASAALGVNHEAYLQMEASGLSIVRLKEAKKTYRNLTIRLLPATASRSVFTDKRTTRGRDLIEMAVRYVRSVAPEEVLIVSYKRTAFPLAHVDEKAIALAIDARLDEQECQRVRHLTWGQHTATNDHVAVRHVLLMGLNFVSPVTTYADSSALLNKQMRSEHPDEHPSREQLEDLRRARLKDTVLQAVLRGAARKGFAGDCGTMEVVIPQSKQTGLSVADYREVFPEVSIVHDRQLLPRKVLKGKLAALAEAVRLRVLRGEIEITNKDLSGALKMDERSFRRLVKHADWKDAMDDLGVVPQILAGGRVGLRVCR